jgi:hypothetical protein
VNTGTVEYVAGSSTVTPNRDIQTHISISLDVKADIQIDYSFTESALVPVCQTLILITAGWTKN